MAQPDGGGTERFHSTSDAMSHMKHGMLWGNYPGNYDIFFHKVSS